MAELMINSGNFDEVVLKADKAVLVDFWAPWCGPCRAMGPVLTELDEKADGKYLVGKVNVDEEPELARKYKVMSIPAIKIFKDGKIAASIIGVTPVDKLAEMLEKV